jgi:hypothetical protein
MFSPGHTGRVLDSLDSFLPEQAANSTSHLRNLSKWDRSEGPGRLWRHVKFFSQFSYSNSE